jgi:hypothetical protein
MMPFPMSQRFTDGAGRKGCHPRGPGRAVDLTEENVDSLIEAVIEDA